MNMHVLITCLVAQLMLLGACGTSTTPDGSSQEDDQASESDSGKIEDSSQNEIGEGENTEIGDNNMPTSAEILEALGAEGVEGADPNAVASYQNMFNGLDSNGDSIVTVEEYIAFGHFDEEKARAIFAASDRDQNGEMTQDEYVENRIITDEAKLIFEGLDSNQDGNLLESEFVENAAFEDPISSAVYALFDANGDGELMVPEYLQVWGAWARGEDYP
jgi:Ca2+-binding EF-hand superfamily protein